MQNTARNVAIDVYGSGFFKQILDKCEGCERIVAVESGKYCRTYAEPAAKWKNGLCNFATHAKPEIVTASVKVNPLKAAKRAAKRK